MNKNHQPPDVDSILDSITIEKEIILSENLHALLVKNNIPTNPIPIPIRIALTHKSAGHKESDKLEFLGDAMLAMTIKKFLLNRYPKHSLCQLNSAYNNLTCNAYLTEVGINLQLNQSIVTSGINEKVIADSVESIIGAFSTFLSSNQLENIILQMIIPSNKVPDSTFKQPPTSILQNKLLNQPTPLKPQYNISKTNQYKCILKVTHYPDIITTAASPQLAKQKAAQTFLEQHELEPSLPKY